MEEKNNAKSKKKLIYYLILGICALLLIAGLVLTVYFVTGRSNPVAEKPPVQDPDDNPSGSEDPTDPDDKNPDDQDPDDQDPDDPTGGEAERFVAPVDYEDFAVVYSEIYENKTVGWWYRHKAVDFEAAAGTEVKSMADGTVVSVSISEETGNLITVDHGDGLQTLYRFVEPVEGLKAGDKVTKGQKIGEVAAAYGSEAFQGEHLHLEVMFNGDFADPADYLEPVLQEK